MVRSMVRAKRSVSVVNPGLITACHPVSEANISHGLGEIEDGDIDRTADGEFRRASVRAAPTTLTMFPSPRANMQPGRHGSSGHSHQVQIVVKILIGQHWQKQSRQCTVVHHKMSGLNASTAVLIEAAAAAPARANRWHVPRYWWCRGPANDVIELRQIGNEANM